MPTTRPSRRRGDAAATTRAAAVDNDADAVAAGRLPRRRRRSVSPLGDVDPATRWLYEPHTLTGLAIGESVVLWGDGAFICAESKGGWGGTLSPL